MSPSTSTFVTVNRSRSVAAHAAVGIAAAPAPASKPKESISGSRVVCAILVPHPIAAPQAATRYQAVRIGWDLVRWVVPSLRAIASRRQAGSLETDEQPHRCAEQGQL